MAPAPAAAAGAGAVAEAVPNASALQKELADLLGSPRTGENIAPEAALANASALQQQVADIVEQMSPTKGSKPPPPPRPATALSPQERVEKYERLLEQDKELQTKKKQLQKQVERLLNLVQSFQKDSAKHPSNPTEAEQQLEFINNFKRDVGDLSVIANKTRKLDELQKIEKDIQTKEDMWNDFETNFLTPTAVASESMHQNVPVAPVVQQPQPVAASQQVAVVRKSVRKSPTRTSSRTLFSDEFKPVTPVQVAQVQQRKKATKAQPPKRKQKKEQLSKRKQKKAQSPKGKQREISIGSESISQESDASNLSGFFASEDEESREEKSPDTQERKEERKRQDIEIAKRRKQAEENPDELIPGNDFFEKKTEVLLKKLNAKKREEIEMALKKPCTRRFSKT